jgi:hypothetical protein
MLLSNALHLNCLYAYLSTTSTRFPGIGEIAQSHTSLIRENLISFIKAISADFIGFFLNSAL